MPQDLYTQQLLSHRKALLTKLAGDAKEFKDSSIKAGNADIYLEILWNFVNVAASLGDVAPVYSIIAIDSVEVYSGAPFTAIYQNVIGAIANLGITDKEHLAAEFSRQILWLHVHFPYVAGEGFRQFARAVFRQQAPVRPAYAIPKGFHGAAVVRADILVTGEGIP